MEELSRLIYEHRLFAISSFGLCKEDVYLSIDVPDELVGAHSRKCDTCSINDFNTDNPMIICDGCNSCRHISCVGLKYMPHIDWICDKCVADGLFLIDEVLGKRRHQGRVEYRIRWAPRSGESAADAADRETWQAVADLPSGRQSVCSQKPASETAAFNAEVRGPG